MATHKEFYYDDLVISTDDGQKKCSIGLVTKEKPLSPTFLKKLNTKDSLKSDNDKLEDIEAPAQDLMVNSYESDDDDSSSEGNLYDPPQKETVKIHKYYVSSPCFISISGECQLVHSQTLIRNERSL